MLMLFGLLLSICIEYSFQFPDVGYARGDDNILLTNHKIDI
jgi:hypothetical protein